MKILKTAEELARFVESTDFNHPVGFVPTMGALHEGHITLLKKAKEQNKTAGVSIFVNPLQFNNASDFTNYPIDTDNDIRLLQEAEADFLFIPQKENLLHHFTPPVYDLAKLNDVMEGPFRPGHFQGVAGIVHLLFSLVKPDRAYFGEKDFQQLAVIRHMTKTLNLPVEIVGCPTVREANGLAMSSRNRRLSEEQKEKAGAISRFICSLREVFPENTPTEIIRREVFRQLEQRGFVPDYFELCNPDTLEPSSLFSSALSLQACIAYHAGEVRLIDNCAYTSV